MVTFTSEEFEETRMKGEDTYKSIGEVYCPYFKEKISFNSEGLEHLRFKKREVPRLMQDQYIRLKLIHLAPKVLELSHTIQGIQETKRFERIRINSRTDTLLKPVNYFQFIAVIKRNRVKIVVKQIDYGNKFFWSIIPFWGMNIDTMTRLLHDGTPEEE